MVSKRLKIIGIEEHFWSAELRDTLLAIPEEEQGVRYLPGVAEQLTDVGEGRFRDMEALGVDQQILSVSTPATQLLDPAEAVRLSRQNNDLMARVVAENPERFPAALATLPMTNPPAAVEELERCVTELGLKGSMIHGRTGDRYLDHPDFAAILDKSSELKAPVYIHPQRSASPIADYLYMRDLPDDAAWMLSTGAWGWHVDTGLNAIRLVISGTFERAPDLKIILGHWGEMVTFWMPRISEMLQYLGTSSSQPFSETFREHFWVGPSGIWDDAMLQHAIAVLGADRIVFSTDYPFCDVTEPRPRRFLEAAPISQADREKIGHGNLERLLSLDVD